METNVLVALLIITGLAALIPIFAQRLNKIGIPTVVLEIIAGMAIGTSGLNLIEPSPILTFLAEFGFAFLMFLSGLELDMRLLNPRRAEGNGMSKFTQALPLGVIMLVGTLLLATLATVFLAPPGASSNPILLGLILSTTSLGVVVPVLKERELTGTRFGQYILVAASIADFVTLLLLTIVIAIMRQGLTLDLLLIAVLLLIFIMAARFSVRASQGGHLQRALNSISGTTSQIRVRGAIALMVAWVVLAEGLGVELILGAFLAGAIAGLLTGDDDQAVREKLDGLGYGFFIPIFFIMVGVQFNLQAVFESTQGLFLLAWLVAVAFTVKIFPALLLKLRFTWNQTISGGLLLSSRLSLIIAASAIALSMGLISDIINSEIILLAIISVTVAPFLFNRIYPRSADSLRHGVIVIGLDQLTQYIIERLKASGEQVTVICTDPAFFDFFKKLDVPIFQEKDGYAASLKAAGAGQARVLLNLTQDSQSTLEVCRLAKMSFEIPLVVSRVSDLDLIPELNEIGIRVVQPELATAMALEGAVLFPSVFDVLVHRIEDIEVTEFSVTNPAIAGTRLGDIKLPGDTLVLSLQRDNTFMIPHGNTVLKVSDRLGLIGSPTSVQEAGSLLKG